ncbi:hypothetical protein Celaphus_00018492 [Cervus elaphus hippelaphus]|uniref:Uncharacterized protein n=1 Tax=Cervus elaphus hippelaphus TaxID=46360 RepID=A0A212CLX3_CEREH|nr:hypothetical protein Celaphus_00018492 [Cervus elaphus hippelaphus]
MGTCAQLAGSLVVIPRSLMPRAKNISLSGRRYAQQATGQSDIDKEDSLACKRNVVCRTHTGDAHHDVFVDEAPPVSSWFQSFVASYFCFQHFLFPKPLGPSVSKKNDDKITHSILLMTEELSSQEATYKIDEYWLSTNTRTVVSDLEVSDSFAGFTSISRYDERARGNKET